MLNLNNPETRAFKGTCYITNMSFSDGKNPTNFVYF